MALDELMHKMKRDAVTGGLVNASMQDLTEYSAALCSPHAYSHLNVHEFPQIAETVRINLLRAHIQSLQEHVVALHDHITDLDTKNTTLQKLVVALTVASLIGTGAQVWYAAKADKIPEATASPIAIQPQAPTQPQLAPILSAPQKAHPPKQRADAK